MSTFDIVGLIETWSNYKGKFSNTIEGFTFYDSVRQRSVNSLRNSGGVGAFVRNNLLKDGFIARICHDFVDCVVLYCKLCMFHYMADMIMYITYISPEWSSIYNNLDENNGNSILEGNISSIRN